MHSKKIPLYGKRPPSTRQERISFDEVRRSSFLDGAVKMKRNYEDNIYFTELTIKKIDLDELIAAVQFEAGFHDAGS